jgi:2-succinyl-6-hydroxy-2,4-cyclohexadiene-1-carboxylate synthase
MSGTRIHVASRGTGTPLVLLHGFTGSGRSMASLAEAFEGEYETVMPDLPGHGLSVGSARTTGYDFDRSVDALVAAVESAGVLRGHWLGYSMGARLALACAVRHPGHVASLVLIAGRAGIADPAERASRRAADERLAARIEAIGIEAFVDEWLAQPLFATLHKLGPGFLAAQRAARLANDPFELAASLRGLGPAAQPPLFDQLPRVTVPVLLVVGALDTRFVAVAHDLARRLPHAEVCEIADAGHAVHVEQPAALVGAVHDFLRRASLPARNDSKPSAQEIAS